MNRTDVHARPCSWAALTAVLLMSLVASADPPVRSDIDLPPGFFCIRVTQQELVASSMDGNGDEIGTFNVMLEILNWTTSEVSRFDLWVTDGGGATVEMSNAWIDENGRPFPSGLNPTADGCTTQPPQGMGHYCMSTATVFDNFAVVEFPSGFGTGTCVPAKYTSDGCGRPNNWGCTTTPSQSNPGRIDSVTYMASVSKDYLPNRDVLNFGSNTTEDACELIPGCTIDPTTNLPILCEVDDSTNKTAIDQAAEAVDNSTDTAPGAVDNVLDGFAFQIANVKVGEHIDLNWATYDPYGYTDPAFGRGTLAIYLHSSDGSIGSLSSDPSKDHVPFTSVGPALWTGPAGSNTGTHSRHRDIPEPTLDTGHHFEVEVGVGLTAPGLQPPPGSPAPDAERLGVPVIDVPTLSPRGLTLMVLCLMALGYFLLRG